eukprot:COSAG01_NODE_157_length_23722_cov_85.712568_15_plen_170_part_00
MAGREKQRQRTQQRVRNLERCQPLEEEQRAAHRRAEVGEPAPRAAAQSQRSLGEHVAPATGLQAVVCDEVRVDHELPEVGNQGGGDPEPTELDTAAPRSAVERCAGHDPQRLSPRHANAVARERLREIVQQQQAHHTPRGLFLEDLHGFKGRQAAVKLGRLLNSGQVIH